jgi:hypothetical protein
MAQSLVAPGAWGILVAFNSQRMVVSLTWECAHWPTLGIAPDFNRKEFHHEKDHCYVAAPACSHCGVNL